MGLRGARVDAPAAACTRGFRPLSPGQDPPVRGAPPVDSFARAPVSCGSSTQRNLCFRGTEATSTLSLGGDVQEKPRIRKPRWSLLTSSLV